MTDHRPDAVLVRELRKAQEKVSKASEARRALPPGSSRARVTSANARWSTACEARDRIELELWRRRLRAKEGAPST